MNAKHNLRLLMLGAAMIGALAACNKQEATAPETAAPTEAAAPAAAEGLKLYAMDCGHFKMNDLDDFADDGAYKGQAGELVDPCYLIRHPKGDLIWDVGLPEALADSSPASLGPGEEISVSKKLTAQLAELGLAPADIEFISVSHSHLDHIGNGNLFAPASTWIVDADEYAYAFRDEAKADAQSFPNYSALETAKKITIEGDADYDVFGDGTAKIIQAPGHTPGHTILLVTLPNSGPILLTGDMYHVAASREARRVPRFNTNRAQTLASMDKVESIAAATNARVVRQHVPEDFAAMPAFPAALD